MVTFSRDASGFYFASAPGAARVGFLLADTGRTDQTFELTAASWLALEASGYFAFFSPSATRDWDAFATQLRQVFAANYQAQFGWFDDAGSNQPVLIATDWSSSPPSVAQSVSLAFRQSVTFAIQPSLMGGNPTVRFDDASEAFRIEDAGGAGDIFVLTAALPAGSSVSYASAAPCVAIPVTGDLSAAASVAFDFTANDLTQFEAGMMYFTPPQSGGQIGALGYPVFRPAGEPADPFGFDVTLDVLAPLDPLRTFFRFTDPAIGTHYTSANGTPLDFGSIAGSVGSASRFVFASRPVQSPGDTDYYYLTPAGQFTAAPAADPAATAEQVAPARMLCGITGTEFLDLVTGTTPDRLEFVPAQPAWRIPAGADSASAPLYFSDAATTSYARFLTSEGAYVAQPQSAPLYAQGGGAALRDSAPPASGLTVHLLDFLPIDSWTPAQPPPATPLVPYGGLNFATDPNLNRAAYVDMESNALNPRRSEGYLSAAVASNRATRRPLHAALAATGTTMAMTPQGMLAGIAGTPPTWTELQMAISAAGVLALDSLGPEIRRVLQQDQIFAVISTDPGDLFGFSASILKIGDWTFDLSPAGLAAPDATPPIFVMKFYPGTTIADLVDDVRLWSQPDVFNTAPFTPQAAQAYLQQVIADAKAAVFPGGATEPDTDSLYWTFYRTVTDPAFTGVLAVNCNMRLDTLPGAIRAVLGGMKDPGIPGFRVHHAGVAINNTDPSQLAPALAKSATFALVDYKSMDTGASPTGLDVDFGFEVAFLRALFTNSELRSFACEIDLTVNSLFETGVNQSGNGGANIARAANGLVAAGDAGNTITIIGSYQAHDTSAQGAAGEGIYAFIAQGEFVYDFTDKDGKPNNNYLKSITLTKLQFSFDDETPATSQPAGGTTSRIASHFGIWGSIAFNELKVLDIFAFEKLEFSDLGIDVGFDLTISTATPPEQPSTANLALGFSPGNLRLDLGATQKRSGSDSLLDLIPFKLKSFLYATGDGQSIESLDFYSLSDIAGLAENGLTLQNMFNYALVFDLDLGSLGGLVGSLSAFQFSMLIGWRNPAQGGGIAFGVQLPQVDGKLEIKIQGVLTIAIEQFTLLYAKDSDPRMLVLGLQDCFVELLGTRMPPKGTVSLGLFAPTQGADQIGWIGAYNLGEDGGGGGGGGGGGAGGETRPFNGRAVRLFDDEEGDDGGIFALTYVGLGQRVGPDPAKPPTNYADFLSYMQTDFWEKLKTKDFADIYHPNGRWIFVADFTLLKLIQVGVVFYDVTPFYALQISLVDGPAKGFSFEITYTKVTDSIGLYAIKLALPDSLRTFQIGVASLTLPTLSLSIYTNGDWKVDLGFPDGDDWSMCFRIQAQAGPVPVTGSGGFYVASLSSATDPDVFKGSYQAIQAFGFALRLGIGKDFVAGPLKAGVSVTFFGIIQGAAGYLTSGGGDIFRTPDALSLKGQIGIIGELYGSLDFVIIKASVNVRLQASIGLVLTYEPKVAGGGDGSILLYIEASVSVSVSVKINLFFFSVTISFSFKASFRFEWQLAGSSQANTMLLAGHRTLRALAAPPELGLLPGLPVALPLLYLPELTMVFADATAAGVPWLAVSLGVEYDPAPIENPPYAAFKPFEAVATQLATFALMHALGISGYDAVVMLDDDPVSGTPGLRSIDSAPELLTGWMGVDDVFGQLANFTATIAVPTQATQATVFPMPPFLQLATTGRTDGTNADDLSYVFASKNPVPQSYLATVDAYFNQLFVNQATTPPLLRLADDAQMPLPTEIFLDYFKGLVRGAVHQALVTMQDRGLAQAKLDDLFRAVAGAPTPGAQSLYQQLAGQMSSSMRSGVRLPYTAGLTIPGGGAAADTNALFALLWQEFPVGGFGESGAYTISLRNPDATQGWITADADYTLTQASVAGYAGLTQASIVQPGDAQPIDFTDVGPQAFAFQGGIVWTSATGATLSLQPFPPSLQRLQLAEASAPVSVLVQSRPADAPYQAGGTPLPSADVELATTVGLTVRQMPGPAQGSVLPDLFALSGASQADEALLGRLLDALRGGETPVASIEILYQNAAGVPGLVSTAIDRNAVFVLRTNTTSVSQPPPLRAMAARVVPEGVSVGATANITADGGYGFLQIIQQATVTNAAGYYLRYVDTAGQSLPAALFQKGVGQVTLLVRYTAAGGDNNAAAPLAIAPYHNAALLANLQPSLVYYAETTDPMLAIRYAATAAGTFGVALARTNGGIDRDAAIVTLRAGGVSSDDDLHAALFASGAAPAALNALYSLVSYRVSASAGFVGSNLSAPIQPQRPGDDDSDSRYRIIAPLYNLATANVGLANPNRYASIGAGFAIEVFTNDAFGNQLPAPTSFADTNLYFDPILPLDQWTGIIASYDFSGAAGTIALALVPSQSAFTGMSADERAAARAHYATIGDQLTGPGVSFHVETSLAPAPLVVDAAPILALVAAMAAWLEDPNQAFPAAVRLSLAVAGTGSLPPVFALTVLFGIQRDPALVSPHIKDKSGAILLPSAQSVASGIAAATGDSGNLSAFAADFVAAFPARKLAVGLTGTPSGAQALWAVEAALLDIAIGRGEGSGPRFLSPKPLDNALGSATVAMPRLAATLPHLPAQRQFVDVDLDRFNRSFFQAVDSVLGPASAAQAFQAARAAYVEIARGRETIAGQYATHEVDWLFDAASPFTGSAAQKAIAAEVFAQQMRAALMTAYAVDTLIQYDVAWNAAVSPAAAQNLELFGQIEAIVVGEYAWSGTTLTATTAAAHALSDGDRLTIVFTAATGSSAPGDGVYTVAVTSDTQFTISVESGSGQGSFAATRQNAGLSTAHVAVSSTGTSPLTILYGTPDVASRAVIAMDLRFNVTNIQYFLGAAEAEGAARPSLWLQLIDPYPTGGIPHLGPADTPTQIPVVFRQYPTPPTLLRQNWTMPPSTQDTASPIADTARWDYVFAYQAFLAAQDRINAAITYNTDLSAGPSRRMPGGDAAVDPVYTLFEALARATAVIDAVRPILQVPTDSAWPDAVAAFADTVIDVTRNSNWNPAANALAIAAFAQLADSYAVVDMADASSQTITLVWPGAQGESSYPGASLSLVARDPGSPTLEAYPGQVMTTSATAVTIDVPDAPLGALGVVHEIGVGGLNVLAAENALASVQVERNAITLTDTGGAPWDVITEFVYKTAQVRSSQPVTPFIDVAAPIDVTTLPSLASASACTAASPSSLCQRVHTIVANLLADPEQSARMLAAHAKFGAGTSTTRRMMMSCAFRFPLASAGGLPSDDLSISPVVPVVLARSFDIDGQDAAQIGDFAAVFAHAIDGWAAQNTIAYGSGAEPAGAQFVFDVTLYAALSGADTPVLRFTSLMLRLTDIDPI